MIAIGCDLFKSTRNSPTWASSDFEECPANGPNLRLFVDELFGNYASALAMADLTSSSIVFWSWLFVAAWQKRIRFPWIYVALNLIVGLCFALPTALFMLSRSDRKVGLVSSFEMILPERNAGTK